MSGRLLRLVCTAAVAACAALGPAPALAVPTWVELPAAEPPAPTGTHAPASPEPSDTEAPGSPAPADRSVAQLLTDFQRLYREAERATEAYNATQEKLKEQRAEAERIERRLARARLSLHDSRSDAGRLARQQYQSRTDISPYVRLLLARDPQRALDQGQVIRQLTLERAETVKRLAGNEEKAASLAREARRALDARLSLTERRRKERDDVQDRLAAVEELLASLTDEQLRELTVQAPRPGARLRVSPIAAHPVLGAVRPDPLGEPLRQYTPPELPEGATDGSDEGYASALPPVEEAR